LLLLGLLGAHAGPGEHLEPTQVAERGEGGEAPRIQVDYVLGVGDSALVGLAEANRGGHARE